MAEQKPVLVQFRPGELLDDLRGRGSNLSGIAKRDLDRYYTLLSRHLGETTQLSYEQAILLVACMDGQDLDLRLIDLLPALIRQTLKLPNRAVRNVRQVFNVGDYYGRLLAEKVETLSFTERLALCDLVEQWRWLARDKELFAVCTDDLGFGGDVTRNINTAFAYIQAAYQSGKTLFGYMVDSLSDGDTLIWRVNEHLEPVERVGMVSSPEPVLDQSLDVSFWRAGLIAQPGSPAHLDDQATTSTVSPPSG